MPENSYEAIAHAVREYWANNYPCDVVVFFFQKYSFESEAEWTWMEELAFCESDSDYETVTFLSDFCEGQTDVKNIVVVPLSEVTEYYSKEKLKGVLYNGRPVHGL